MNKEYAPIGGEADFGKLSANLAFGEGNSIVSDLFSYFRARKH